MSTQTDNQNSRKNIATEKKYILKKEKVLKPSIQHIMQNRILQQAKVAE